MQNTNLPAKTPTPFADSAGGAYKRAVPAASQIGITLGAASFHDGFPPACFSPIAGGGSWPFGQDFNGLLNQMSAWERWFQAGGVIKYDATFQTAIGGYPLGARVESVANPGLIWRSSTENNVTNPDAAGAGWSVIAFPDPGSAGFTVHALTATGANIRLEGDGVTTPNKTIRAHAGVLQIMNNAYSASLFGLTDAGDLTLVGALAAGTTINSGGAIVAAAGNITANAGKIRAAVGAYLSADPAAGTILSDFLTANTSPGSVRLPNGLIFEWGAFSIPANSTLPVNFLPAFPNSCLSLVVSLGSSLSAGQTYYIGAEPVSTAQFTATCVSTATPGPFGAHWLAVGY
jgi:hypothetical protein